MQDDRKPNLLLKEKSPYLLQHAYNPVEWRPWSDEAFALAQKEDKPVFVSIGYATCHWCHVMEHESFENEEIAAYLNEHFICIKVDREERPDVDGIYMEVCQAMTGRGGWPLTVFMDSERRPFFAGTYFPPKTRANNIGFLDLINRVSHAWKTDRDRIDESAQNVIKSLQASASASFRGEVPGDVFERVAEHHKKTFDEAYGGFGDHPKFPSPHHLLLLFRIARRAGDTELLRMATQTLDAMRAGGIYDQVGFGFHRYSTDSQWILPHFEKMLYDQAMLMMAFTEAWQITGREIYAKTCLEIATYLSREMTSEEGAFFTAQDADSEGEEGRYYVWETSELAKLLSEDQIQWLRKNMSVISDGNFQDEATGGQNGSNILHFSSPLKEMSSKPCVEQDEWEAIRSKLMDHREGRIKPITDDKVLTDWNGLMITALARAARAFNEGPYLEMARKAYKAINELCGGDEWVHRYRDGHRHVQAMLDDRAATGLAALELYQSTGETSYLADARLHADAILEEFSTDDGGLATVAKSVTDIPVRQKDGYDSAYPSGNSLAAWLFTGLGTILAEFKYQEAAQATVVSFGKQINQYAAGFCMLLGAWDVLENGASEIVFVGGTDDEFLRLSRDHIGGAYLPEAFWVYGSSEASQDMDNITKILRKVYPFDAAKEPAVLVCTNHACRIPFVTMNDVNSFLNDEAHR